MRERGGGTEKLKGFREFNLVGMINERRERFFLDAY